VLASEIQAFRSKMTNLHLLLPYTYSSQIVANTRENSLVVTAKQWNDGSELSARANRQTREGFSRQWKRVNYGRGYHVVREGVSERARQFVSHATSSIDIHYNTI